MTAKVLNHLDTGTSCELKSGFTLNLSRGSVALKTVLYK